MIRVMARCLDRAYRDPADRRERVVGVLSHRIRKRVHRVLVTRRGKLVGIVTSMELLRGLLRRSELQARPAASRARRR